MLSSSSAGKSSNTSTYFFSPAGGEFTVEIADNRAQTTLSYGGKYASEWADGKTYPDDYVSYVFILAGVFPLIFRKECADLHRLAKQ